MMATQNENPQHNDLMRLRSLTASLEAVQRLNYTDTAIRTVTDDSRQVKPGALFVAVEGEVVDGHGFIPEAFRRGAAAIVCERLPQDPPPCPVLKVQDSRLALSGLASHFYQRPAHSLRMIGVTGTDGKTTTTELIRAILQEAGHGAGCLNTVRSEVGRGAQKSQQTTPHPLRLHGMLREMVDAGLTHACVEVSSHALVHQRTAHVPFDTAVLTNVTRDHLDFHGSVENYIRAKQMLFEQLSSESVAVLNAESPVWWRYSNATSANVLTYGIDATADVRLMQHRSSIEGTRMRIRTPLDSFNIYSPLVGDYNCENVLAAVTAAFGMGLPPEAIASAIEKFTGVGGRLEKIKPPADSDLPTVFVDFAHTPNALQKVLATLRPLTEGQLICVFGCGGDRDRDKRPRMGKVATDIADLTVLTADNSRSEKTEDILTGIVGGIEGAGARYTTEPNRRRAIEAALYASTSSNDVVVLCGRGCEQFQKIGDQRIPFDDRVVVAEILRRGCGEQKKIA